MLVPLEVFCCYARDDLEMLEHLKKHLTPLQRQGQITIWSDTNLNAGMEWEKELHQHLESADIILLLISPDFMASDYCYSTEMGRAIARHNEGSTVVIPILLRSTFWQNAPFAKLQMTPTNVKPITNWSDRDDAFHDIAMQVNQVVSKLVEADQPPQGYVVEQVETVRIPFLVPAAFDPAKLTLLHTVTGYTDRVLSIAISPDGKTLAGSSHNEIIKLWELPSGRELRMLTGPMRVVFDMAISADGKVLASGSDDKTIRLSELPSGRQLRTLIGHKDIVYGIAISPDGKILASGSQDHTIKLWELPSGCELHTLIGHTKAVTGIAISPDGTILASNSWDNTIKLWELPSGRELRTLTSPTTSIAISPDGTILASGSQDHTIKLWELPSGRELHTLTGHTSSVGRVVITPDGKILASIDHRCIKFWELPSGQELHTLLTKHTLSILSIAISPDGKILASGGNDHTIRLWGMES